MQKLFVALNSDVIKSESWNEEKKIPCGFSQAQNVETLNSQIDELARFVIHYTRR